MSYFTNGRHAEDEDLLLLKSFAEKNLEAKGLKNEMDQMKPQIVEILSRESEIFDDKDGERHMFVNAYRFEVSHRRQYDEKYKKIEREVIINGQEIFASVEQLEEAAKNLSGFLKSDTFLKGHSTAVTVKV